MVAPLSMSGAEVETVTASGATGCAWLSKYVQGLVMNALEEKTLPQRAQLSKTVTLR